MRRILLKLSYDGTNYHGWQFQDNAIAVGEVFQDAVERVFEGRLDIHGCSRTDSGVHANEYFCHLDTDSSISCKNIVRALNSYLPKDIVALDATTVSDDFHARYSAKSKEYIYKIYNHTEPNPFYANYYLHFQKRLDEDRMDRVAKLFLGIHDFKGFCSAKSKIIETTRTIYESSAQRNGNEVIFKILGDGFLYNMVRIIVGTLIFVEMGSIDENDIPKIIESKDRRLAGKTAPAHGLYLNRVVY